MYYGNGTYESGLKARDTKENKERKAYIIGSGLAGLSTAFFLIRDAHLDPKNIHILEKHNITGGACDGIKNMTTGFIMRGGREMDNHFECMWDMYKDIKSYEDESMSVLDYYYYLNLEDPNYSLCRATVNRGKDAGLNNEFKLNKEAQKELLKLFMIKDELLYDKKINEIFTDNFFSSNFWLYWQTMFAFQKESSALEMKRYLKRYIHHIKGLPDFSALRFTRYNQYESMILPIQNHILKKGVQIEFGYDVYDVDFQINDKEKIATKIKYRKDGVDQVINLDKKDLVFITNGSCTDQSRYGYQNEKPNLEGLKNAHGDSWDLWLNISKKDKAFGNPLKFCNNIEKTNWMSATIETKDDKIINRIKEICKRDPRSGKVTTGGIITVKDSSENWYLSWTINRQPQFISQDKDTILIWMYSLSTTKEGNFVKKAMKDCKGYEVCMEWLYHLGFDESEIEELAKTKCNTNTCYMPYINAFFEPRTDFDRPKVVPDKALNFAFIGQFAETPRDTIFTTEYSIRTAMESTYTLCNVKRAVPEVYGSTYDIRCLLNAVYYSLDKKKVTDTKLTFKEKFLLKRILKKIRNTDVEKILTEYHII